MVYCTTRGAHPSRILEEMNPGIQRLTVQSDTLGATAAGEIRAPPHRALAQERQ